MRAFTFRDPAFLRMVQGGGGGGGGGGGSSSLALSDLTALWRLDEALGSADAEDATGNGHTLGLYDGDVEAVAGKINGARRAITAQSSPPAGKAFHIGSDEVIFGLGNLDYSAFGWLKDEEPEGGAFFRMAFHIGPQGTDGGFMVISTVIDAVKKVRLITSSIPYAATPFVVAADTTSWTFWAAGFNSSTGKFWLSVNGAARIFRAASFFTISGPGRTVAIGETISGDKQGILNDGVGFRLGQLSDAQIAWLYNSGTGRDITA